MNEFSEVIGMVTVTVTASVLGWIGLGLATNHGASADFDEVQPFVRGGFADQLSKCDLLQASIEANTIIKITGKQTANSTTAVPRL